MQDLAGVAHSEVDLSVLPEPLATDDTGFRFQHCDLMVHYHAHAGEDLLPLDEVKNAVNAITANWYSLAIQLDIDYKTRKVRIDIHALHIHCTVSE